MLELYKHYIVSIAKKVLIISVFAGVVAAAWWLLRPRVPKGLAESAPPQNSATPIVFSPRVVPPMNDTPVTTRAAIDSNASGFPTAAGIPAPIGNEPRSAAAAPPTYLPPDSRAPDAGVGERTSEPPQPAPEILGTARMIAAHASLRAPEVADPDSDTNRQILQTMVTKAFDEGKHPPVKITAQ